MTKKSTIRIALIFGALLLVFGLILAVLLGGVYNVGAIDGHTRIVEWTLRTTMENSVRNHAQGVKVPDTIDLTDPLYARNFYGHYSAACQTCHGAPGQKADPWMIIYPEAPDLTQKETVEKWSDSELFWILKHGIKDTGMMALGPTHSDEDIWGVTAFVKQLPYMSAKEYQAIAEWVEEMSEKKEHKH